MQTLKGNIFDLSNYSFSPIEEFFETIFQNENIKVERIISYGNTTPTDFWYDQDEYEFVILLKGNAILEFEKSEKISMNPGDFILIEPHQKHRVVYTSTEEHTFWLTVFFKK